ncbi:hypothetical protein AVEN_212210-1 [Araneus ventricosus]|uniref:Uncharacterized protein n=1 Tax=Araneus ventricosus TaxID=182803 RepID=A0A4Y2HTZ9_ARAVE|nr:hypothetical protein AVEN_212210-1 [Araneus ventricosus]
MRDLTGVAILSSCKPCFRDALIRRVLRHWTECRPMSPYLKPLQQPNRFSGPGTRDIGQWECGLDNDLSLSLIFPFSAHGSIFYVRLATSNEILLESHGLLLLSATVLYKQDQRHYIILAV